MLFPANHMAGTQKIKAIRKQHKINENNLKPHLVADQEMEQA